MKSARLTWFGTVPLLFVLFLCNVRCASSTARHTGAIPSAPASDSAAAGTSAPALYRARVTTSKGSFVIHVHREWAALSADRFYQLIHANFYSQSRFYRVVPNFVVQFGMNADPAIHEVWQVKRLHDEKPRVSNKRGTIAFTGSAAPDSRTTHVFINLADNAFLDETTAPFGVVVSGMEVVDALYAGYGEHAPMGTGPAQERLWKEGNRYLLTEFPNLDYIVGITIE
jgi:cyclophilin family peptidyl-prolyl cis-trans isomerase